MLQNKTAIIIPARYESTRLPGKPLLKVKDKPIIQWVYEKSVQSKLADLVIIATDNELIFQAVKDFGANVEMTSKNHQSGSDRIAEVIRKYPEIEIVVNVQGDEPLINPESIDLAIKCLQEDSNADISTLIRKLNNEEEIINPNIVKAVIDNNGYALYFSRSTIPYPRNPQTAEFFGHLGLYAYRREGLLKMTSLEPSSLEKTESLEQLRALQNGMKVKTAQVDYKPIGIDTPEDFEAFKKLIES